MCLFKRSTNKDKTSVLLARKYRVLTSNYTIIVSAHKTNKTELIIELVHNDGLIEFHLYDSLKNDMISPSNLETGTYIYELKPNEKYVLNIKAKGASGSHNIKRKIYGE